VVPAPCIFIRTGAEGSSDTGLPGALSLSEAEVLASSGKHGREDVARLIGHNDGRIALFDN